MERKIEEFLNLGVDKLNFPVRICACLRRNNIHTVRQLLTCTKDDLYYMRNFGEKSVATILGTLENLGIPELHLGMIEEEIEKLLKKEQGESFEERLTDQERNEIRQAQERLQEKEAEAQKAEYILGIARETNARLTETIARKNKALKELEELSKEQERLRRESADLDAKIALLSRNLGIENGDDNGRTKQL